MKSALIRIVILLLFAASMVAAQTTPSPGRWEADILKFEESDRHNPPAPGSIVFIGSSSIRLWTTLAGDFPSARVLNRGFGGSEIRDSTGFVGRIVTPYRPAMVVLYAGDNDVANGRTASQVIDDFQAFVERVQKDLPRVKIAFIAIKPSPSRERLLEIQRDANDRIKQYAAKHKNVSYIDVFTPMLTKDGHPRPELFLEDRLHLNAAGYDLWKKIIKPHLK